jgi:hypothetical protein
MAKETAWRVQEKLARRASAICGKEGGLQTEPLDY